MSTPPRYLGKTKVVEVNSIGHLHEALETATIEVAGEIFGPADHLAICLAEDKESYYLYFCDAKWQIWSDLWFEDMQSAKDYVESYEYSGTAETWRRVSGVNGENGAF